MRCCLLLFPRFVHLAPIKLVRRRAYEPAERVRSPHAASRHVVGDQRRRLARGFCDRPGALVPRAVPEARLEAFRALRTGDAVECREQAAWDDEEGVAHAVLGVAGALFARTGEGQPGEVGGRRPFVDGLGPYHVVPHDQSTSSCRARNSSPTAMPRPSRSATRSRSSASPSSARRR